MIDQLLANDNIPDFLIRLGIRHLLWRRLKEERQPTAELQQARLMELVARMKDSPIAVETGAANQQHYEVPTSFFRLVLGHGLKYSSGYWTNETASLDRAEDDMLRLTVERAGIENGQNILDLGCGWGSLSLWIAERYPTSKVTAVSNSRTQKTFIDEQARLRGLRNLTVLTADMNSFHTEQKFDRVVSVEMFEHMRNYELLLKKISSFLLPNGALFVHIFTHSQFAYFFEPRDDSDWMSRYFFTGGMMPSDALPFYFNDDLRVVRHWRVDGTHYARTAEAWLANMDVHREEILPIFEEVYGGQDALRWWVYWRVFFMSCAELWGFAEGREWMVSHYLLERNGGATVRQEYRRRNTEERKDRNGKRSSKGRKS